MTHLVFVYGTLKKGFHNYHYLQDSEFVGSGRTTEKYALYVDHIPFVVKDEQVSFIYGEIYSVDDSLLAILDQLEGHPSWYCREQIDVILDDDNSVVSACLYFNPDNSGALIASGNYMLNTLLL